MPQGVSGLFSAAASPSAYGNASAARWSEDSQDSSTSFDNVLERARSDGAADSSSPSARTDSPSPSAAAKATASSRGSARKKAAGSDVDQPRHVKNAKNDPSADAEQNASSNGTSDDAEAAPNDSDGSSGGDKPAKKRDAQATVADPSAAVVQLQPAQTPGSVPQVNPGASKAGSAPSDGTPGQPKAGTSGRASARPVLTGAGAAATQADGADSSAPQATGDQAASSDDQSDPSSPLDASDPQGKARLAIQPRDSDDDTSADSAQAAAAAALSALGPQVGPAMAADLNPSDAAGATDAIASIAGAPPATRASATKLTDDPLLQILGGAQPAARSAELGAAMNAGSPADAAPVSATAQFAQANHASVVSGITGRLLPGGGSMQIRLDPPELGAMQVRVEMRDGVMTASFETSNDQATKLLSHSLGDLKTALEAQGVSVERLHVSQAPRQQESSSGNNQKRDSEPRQDTTAQQEQQRREMMQRMWRRLMKGQDPLDLVA
jgi:flagellar hook-length control protein FliK